MNPNQGYKKNIKGCSPKGGQPVFYQNVYICR